MSQKRGVVEVAICEVEVDGKWLEYFRVELKEGDSWKMLRLADVRPKIQVRYEKIDQKIDKIV